jgi:hypothetical protein
MVVGARGLSVTLVVLFGAAVGALGCDAGGLLVAEGNNPGKVEPAKAHRSTELVNGGTAAKNDKYKVVYVVGQPSPQQGVATSPGQRVNGGLVGAVQSE